MSDAIELLEDEAKRWFSEQDAPTTSSPNRAEPSPSVSRPHEPQLHLLFGDSIAGRAAITSQFQDDEVFDRTQGGETWSSLLCHVGPDIIAWQTAATSRGLKTGCIIIWLTGNDIYSKVTLLPQFDDERLADIGLTIKAVVSRLRRHAAEILVLGPLPRLAGEVVGATWESTAAYHLERTTLKAELGSTVRVIPLGRSLTRKMGRKRNGIKGCEAWFQDDGVHLTREGYEKVANAGAFPEWLNIP